MAEGQRVLGPLGRRLLAAFVAVAFASVAVITVAALIGADRGITVAQRQMRQHMSAHAGGTPATMPPSAASGQQVAWSWIIGATAVALLIAVVAGWYVSRRLTAPLLALADAAHAFTRGDRSARVRIRPPGELGDVARAFDGMADGITRSEAVRRQYAADVAHELRTPLTSLQAGLEELRDGLRDPEPARLAGLHDQALRLGRVVDDLAELAAAESASLTLRLNNVDLADVVAAAVDAQEPRLSAAGLDVKREISRPARVRADADRLHQAVANVLANAARYCRPGDGVVVRVFTDGTRAVAEVADTGPGIPEPDRSRVFERMWRGAGSEAVAGSGIGLAVAHELIFAQNGAITVSPTPGGGTTFRISLPLTLP